MRTRSIKTYFGNHKIDVQKGKIRNVQTDRHGPKIKDDSHANNINAATQTNKGHNHELQPLLGTGRNV